jgi:ABC-2 type transport system permease protein
MIAYLRVLWAGVWVQWRLALLAPVDFILASVLLPVFYTVLFLFLFKATGRLESLAAFGVISPALIGMWATALNVSGEIIDSERWMGLLELVVITPHRGMEIALFGRILTVSLISLISVIESLIVAYVGFGLTIKIEQPFVFAALLLLTALSISAAALIMASTFVLSRSVRLFQNLLSFPFYLLGGLAIPVHALPEWLQPVSRVISLSWASEGLNESLTSTSVSINTFLALVILTFLYGWIGRTLLLKIQHQIRHNGSIGLGA